VLEAVTCPSDKVLIATPYYPRNLTTNPGGGDGLRGSGDPRDPAPSQSGMAYWGRLSFAVNEDVVGAENSFSAGRPGCWRAIQVSGAWAGCRGEASSGLCDSSPLGRRLRGNLEKVFRPGDVGLVFEAGRETAEQTTQETGFSNLVLSAKAHGPYLGDAMNADPNQGGLASDRIPRKRHPKGRLNILYCDGHGGSVQPVKFDPTGKPTEYAPEVRISPYPPHEVVFTAN
jgi:prepilin-type processing-associated H-X9-DG protein